MCIFYICVDMCIVLSGVLWYQAMTNRPSWWWPWLHGIVTIAPSSQRFQTASSKSGTQQMANYYMCCRYVCMHARQNSVCSFGFLFCHSKEEIPMIYCPLCMDHLCKCSSVRRVMMMRCLFWKRTPLTLEYCYQLVMMVTSTSGISVKASRSETSSIWWDDVTNLPFQF